MSSLIITRKRVRLKEIRKIRNLGKQNGKEQISLNKDLEEFKKLFGEYIITFTLFASLVGQEPPCS